LLIFRLGAGGGAGEPWSWGQGRWTAGGSWVQPYLHPSLEHGAVTDGRSSFLFARERMRDPTWCAPGTGAIRADTTLYRQRLSEVLAWPLDVTVVECEPSGRFRVSAGRWGTAPLYLACGSDALHGTWSLPDLSSRAKLESLDAVAVTRALALRGRYTARTLFRDVHQLTERASAEYDPRAPSLLLRYPDPAPHARPRAVRQGVDVVEVFERLLEQAVARRWYDPGESAVELSGGVDSGNVAMTLAVLHPGGALAYALMIGGLAGAQQSRRRAALLEHCGFPDIQVPAWERPPLHPSGRRARGEPVDPLAEPYHEAVELMLAAARARGVRTVFTGDGGDELLSLRGPEWAAEGKVPGRHAPGRDLPPWLGPAARAAAEALDEDLAPRTVVNEATLLGFACRSPQFLAAGLWPVSPLCDPKLIRFAEQLPVEWRRDKRLARVRLARLGFSQEVVHPPLRETFAHLMEQGMHAYGVPLLKKMVGGALLVDLGYVDGARLRAAYERLAEGGPVEPSLFAAVSLELGLRGLLG
jgi:asparagine synthase (glutamine-hydrolysing)